MDGIGATRVGLGSNRKQVDPAWLLSRTADEAHRRNLTIALGGLALIYTIAALWAPDLGMRALPK